MTVESEMPAGLQVVEKLREFPLVGMMCDTSSGLYHRVKGSNQLINWTLNSAEGFVGTAVGTVAPLAAKFPISQVDAKLCQGLEVLESKVPLVKDQPKDIYDKGRNYAVQETVRLRDHGWNKANELLRTRYGNMALNGLDSTSAIADKLIDYVIPPEEGEEVIHPHPNVECEDKVLHTAHTVGTISTKVGRRVYRKVSNCLGSQPAPKQS